MLLKLQSVIQTIKTDVSHSSPAPFWFSWNFLRAHSEAKLNINEGSAAFPLLHYEPTCLCLTDVFELCSRKGCYSSIREKLLLRKMSTVYSDSRVVASECEQEENEGGSGTVVGVYLKARAVEVAVFDSSHTEIIFFLCVV
jgi:hypothetical protein